MFDNITNTIGKNQPLQILFC